MQMLQRPCDWPFTALDNTSQDKIMTPSQTLLPQRPNFRFKHPLRARWAEVDLQKGVFSPPYMTYVDTALAAYWRRLALPYEQMVLALGAEFVLKKVSMDCHMPARFEDQIVVSLCCQQIQDAALVVKAAIHRGNDLLVTCELRYAFEDRITQSARPVHNTLRPAIENFEAGGSAVTLKTGAWEELGWDAMEVRIEVFVDEQLIPLALENDTDDAAAFHAVAYNGMGQAVATGRLLVGGPGQGRIGRMAVKRVLRGTGQGAAVLDALQAEARRRGDTELALHAQTRAQGFYERRGFKARGDVFDEVGLPHIEMFLAL